MATRVPFKITHDAALTDDEADGLPPGQAHWWLRKGSDFIKLPRRIRGSEAIDVEVMLEPGGYTLGCGNPRTGGVRVNLMVEGGDEPAPVVDKPKAKAAKPKATGAIDVKGQTIVLTGDLDAIDRDAAKAWLEGLGAKVSSSISKKTTMLIVGREPGPKKLAQAAELGIRVIEEPELVAAFEIPGKPASIAKGSVAEKTDLVSAFAKQLEGHALNPKSLEKYIGPAKFRDLGLYENILWGISIGPQGGTYNVHIDLADKPRFGMQCNCSSRRPCNHSMALVITAQRHFVPPAPPPSGHAEASRYISFME